jgi:hypothetical protein
VPCKATATEKYLTAEAKVKEALNNLTSEIGSDKIFSSSSALNNKRKPSDEQTSKPELSTFGGAN